MAITNARMTEFMMRATACMVSRVMPAAAASIRKRRAGEIWDLMVISMCLSGLLAYCRGASFGRILHVRDRLLYRASRLF
jgi:hypothetical protein